MPRNTIEVSSKTIKKLKSIKLKKKLNSYNSLIEYLLEFCESNQINISDEGFKNGKIGKFGGYIY